MLTFFWLAYRYLIKHMTVRAPRYKPPALGLDWESVSLYSKVVKEGLENLKAKMEKAKR